MIMEPKVGAIYKCTIDTWDELIFTWDGRKFTVVGPPCWLGMTMGKNIENFTWSEGHRNCLDRAHKLGFILLSE